MFVQTRFERGFLIVLMDRRHIFIHGHCAAQSLTRTLTQTYIGL